MFDEVPRSLETPVGEGPPRWTAPASRPAAALPGRRPAPARSRRTSLLLRHWRGEASLLGGCLLACAVLLGLWGCLTLVFSAVDWVWHPREAAAASALLIAALVTAACWAMVGITRAGRRASDQGESPARVHAASGLVALCVIATAGQFGSSTLDWLRALQALAADRSPRAQVSLDAASGRLRIRGVLDLGTTRDVGALLARSPKVELVELDSPGGAAVEGLALARLLLDYGASTLVTRECHSACITVFAAGRDRLMDPGARLGLHSAGRALMQSGRDVDAEHAAFLHGRGVASWLIETERETPNSRLYEPSIYGLLASGLVTGVWTGAQ